MTHFVTGLVMFLVVFPAFRHLGYLPHPKPSFTTDPPSLLGVLRVFCHRLLILEHKIRCFVVILMVFRGKVGASVSVYLHATKSCPKLPGWENGGMVSLIGQNSVWKWGECENKAFLKAKELLKSNNLLIHYDASKPLFLTCDASSYGVGAVLEQKDKDGLLRPVSYASRTMVKAEKNYP